MCRCLTGKLWSERGWRSCRRIYLNGSLPTFPSVSGPASCWRSPPYTSHSLCIAKNQNLLAWPPFPARLYRIHSTRIITFSVGTLMLNIAFTTWNTAYFYSTALFLLLAPKSHKIKASSNIDDLQDSGSHDAFGMCRLIKLKNKWLEFFWAIHRELCQDETLAYEAH